MENRNEEFDLQVNMNLFANSVIEILDLLLKKSKEENIEVLDSNLKQNKKKCDHHERLRKACNFLKDGFSDNNEDKIDRGKIVKKAYKMLTSNLDLLYPEQKNDLFFIKDIKTHDIVTILPGIDIGLVVGKINDDENKVLWGNLLMLYISAANMISTFNKKKDEKVFNVIPHLQKKVVELGIIKNSLFFSNPFVGINKETGKYDIDTMRENFANFAQDGTPGNMDPTTMLKTCGIDKMFDMKQLSSQIKDIKASDIEQATSNISKLLGTEKDTETNNLFGSLVGKVVNKLQQGGENIDIMDIVTSVAQETEKTVDHKKLKNAGSYFNNFMKNTTTQLKEMKDENGNPVGEKLLETMNGPLQNIPGLAGLAGLFGQPQNKK
jgi:hypothetical protein